MLYVVYLRIFASHDYKDTVFFQFHCSTFHTYNSPVIDFFMWFEFKIHFLPHMDI